MKKPTSRKLAIVLLLLCFINSVVLAEIRNASGFEETGYLKIEVEHKGLEVKLDGKVIGYTPLNTLVVPAGKHTVSVSHFDKSNWLSKDWVRDVTIANGDTSFLQVKFKRSISLTTRPYGADVYIEEKNFGETPLLLEIYEDEQKTLTLKKAGFQDTTITLAGKSAQKLDIELSRISKSPDNLRPDDRFEVSENKGYKNKFLWTLGASAVSGALAIYFRTKADDKYSRYKKTGDPDEFNPLYDDAKRFDKYSAVSYATFQVSFVFSFYFFFAYKNR